MKPKKVENIHGVNNFSSVKVTEGFMGTHRDSVFALLDCRWLAAGGERQIKMVSMQSKNCA